MFTLRVGMARQTTPQLNAPANRLALHPRENPNNFWADDEAAVRLVAKNTGKPEQAQARYGHKMSRLRCSVSGMSPHTTPQLLG